LSEARAKNVAKIISDSLDDKTRVAIQGKGKTHAIADNKTREGRAKNRRVEIDITY
jgi:flagellar motor protein MotB